MAVSLYSDKEFSRQSHHQRPACAKQRRVKIGMAMPPAEPRRPWVGFIFSATSRSRQSPGLGPRPFKLIWAFGTNLLFLTEVRRRTFAALIPPRRL